MKWDYKQSPVQHWLSVIPHGYFIVKEENDDGDIEYIVYKGHFGDWYGVAGDPSEKKGTFKSLDAAKKYSP